MEDNRIYALTFVSLDRPGIVAEVTKVLYEKGFNIQDSSSTLLQGVFSMIFLVHIKENFTAQQIKSFFSEDISPSVHKLDVPDQKNNSTEDRYIISVYGADKPGIVHTIAAKLAEHNINIVDLQTQATGTPPKEVYIMILEALTSHDLPENWVQEVKNAAAGIGTDIAIRRLETYEL